ncbi:hypothetical protein [Leuconostoc mesenteroides]|uniref:hypothetical protein n=2 Tax=Leuconostoc mesenteroides TaxID=1245 RepID=UPI0010229ECA|nr:hypothetical protein [Leuconostoc mesenteroides]QBC39771.1 hypothetical protein EQK02_05810 [Leuconostoc mesenteroides]UVV91857.1 hypothetical protein NX809_06000 [Leuconostoc mesenteroides]
MDNFDENEYTPRILNMIKAADNDDNSIETKLTELRKYAEINVRRILNLGSDFPFTLGELKNEKFWGRLNDGNLSKERKNELIEIIDRIKKLANEATHTQRTEEFSFEEYDEALDAIFDLIAYQFVDYFNEYPMKLTSQNEVMSDFSLLPPIIRFKTLDRLLRDDPENIQVLNKFILAIIKTTGKVSAYLWLQNNESRIRSIQYPTNSEITNYIEKCGVENSSGLIEISIKFPCFDNVYDLLENKIDDPNTSVNEQGKLYDSFESAFTFYSNNKSFEFNSEIKKLHSLIDFVYIGRNH